MWPLLMTVASAATYLEVPALSSLAGSSKAVVLGVVRSAETDPAPWGLVTTYVIDVEDTLVGSPRDTVTIQLPGGRMDGRTQTYAGVPQWTEGQEVLVFVPGYSRMPMTGVFTIVNHEVVDPLHRWDGPIYDNDLPIVLSAALLGLPSL